MFIQKQRVVKGGTGRRYRENTRSKKQRKRGKRFQKKSGVGFGAGRKGWLYERYSMKTKRDE